MFTKELGRYPDTREQMFRERLIILNKTEEQKELDLKQQQMGSTLFGKCLRFFKYMAVPLASGNEQEIHKAYLT